MSTELSVELQTSELTRVVQSVFGTMLDLRAYEIEMPWVPIGERLAATVSLAGDWNGALVLECDEGQACRFAGRFLSMDPPDTVDDVVRDVLGELANMVGGNLKCALTGGIRLSMPSVVDGSNYSLRFCGAEIQERLAFQCDEGTFWVTIMTIRP